MGIFGLVGFVGYKTSKVSSSPTHYHANFAVFEDGKQVDFTSPELMHIAPCTDGDSHSDDPYENVHLHDGVGNVVHLHMDGITWKTFFESIQYWSRLEQAQEMAKLAENYTFDIRVNGESTKTDVLNRQIMDSEQLSIHIGSASADIQKDLDLVGDNAKEYNEGKIGIEKCGTTSGRTLWQRFKIAFDF